MNKPALGSMPILTMGLTHWFAPMQGRKRLAFGPKRVASVLHEAMLLSACDRTEMYVQANGSAHSEFPAHEAISGYVEIVPDLYGPQ